MNKQSRFKPEFLGPRVPELRSEYSLTQSLKIPSSDYLLIILKKKYGDYLSKVLVCFSLWARSSIMEK